MLSLPLFACMGPPRAGYFDAARFAAGRSDAHSREQTRPCMWGGRAGGGGALSIIIIIIKSQLSRRELVLIWAPPMRAQHKLNDKMAAFAATQAGCDRVPPLARPTLWRPYFADALGQTTYLAGRPRGDRLMHGQASVRRLHQSQPPTNLNRFRGARREGPAPTWSRELVGRGPSSRHNLPRTWT